MSDPALVPDATVEVEDASVWFGQKVALSELRCSFGAGVTGLLGPNGAGKSTLMRVITGLVGVNAGRVRVAGRDPRVDRDVHRRVALVPEDEAVPAHLTARQLVHYVADLHRVGDRAAPERALAEVDLGAVADRRLGGFSKGMRQRAKVAAALVSDPAVLVLDEPLNGADPVQRAALISLFRRLGADGRTVIVSSHVLHEVERLADRVLVLISGRLAAAGNHRAIRDAMDDRPRHVLVRADDTRRLAAALLDLDTVVGLAMTGPGGRSSEHSVDGPRNQGRPMTDGGPGGRSSEHSADGPRNQGRPMTDGGLVVTTSRAGDLAAAVAPLARRLGVRLREVRPLDDSLESLFRELVR